MIRSTFAGFTTAQLGMSASQAALNVIGQNISNVNTKGFTRQRVDLDSFNVTTGPRQWGSVNDTFIGNGVVVNRVEQVRDPYLDLRFRTEMAGVGYYDKTLASLEDLQSVLDEVEKDGSIHNQLEAVFKALNEFNPQAANNEFQNMAKTELQLLSQYFNNYSNRIEQAKTDNMTEFKEQTIPAINQLLKDITSLNVSIHENEVLGNPALELRDERNLLLDELSNYVKIEVTYDDEYVGLSNKTAAECTVKMVGVDEKGNPFKYTLIDHDKAAEFQIDDECSHLTMTDVNGNPIADIGSALKPNDADTFTDTEVTAINNLLEDIQFFTNAMIKEMQNIDKLNNDINGYGSRIVTLSRRGNELHEELNDILKSVRANDRAIATTQEQLNNATPGSDEAKKLQEKLDSLNNIATIYNQKLYGQDTAPQNIAGLNGLDPNGTGIYNKLLNIYGTIVDDNTKSFPPNPPTYENPATTGQIAEQKELLDNAKKDLAAAKENYAKIVHNLNVAQKGDQYKDGTYADGAYETITDPTGANYTPKANADAQKKGLTGHANVVIEEETFPVEGTKFFIKLPNIKLGGTSAKDGNGIPLFDADTKKVANFAINAAGDEITITDTKGAEYTEEVADVDGTPYELDANGNIVKDENGKPILDMGDQTNMYEKMQEDNGSIKAALDMFNRAGDFDGTKDRGYDYYLNMLDVFARQIAKVFNEANMKDNDGNPLLDSNGKPISYANALFGADGQVPIKNATTPDGKNYLSYGGVTATADKPLPDIFKTDANGNYLDATGAVVNIPNGTTNVPNNVALDASALAAYGIVKYTGEAHTIKDAAGNDVTVNPGDWVDKEGKPLQSGGNNVTKLETLQDLQNSTILDQADPLLNQIANGDLKPMDGKVPKIDYDKITAANFTITKDWADNKTNFVQTHDPSQTAGYNDNINHLISVFGQKLDYTFTLPDGTQKQIFNGTFVEFYDNVGNQLGLDIKSSTVLINNYITIANDIANNRDAISGVSLDEEGIDIMKYQKAYAASARVMTALDEALEKVINGMGVVGR